MLAEEVISQAASRGLTVYEVDGTRSVRNMASLIQRHLGLPLRSRTKRQRSELHSH